MLDQLTISLNFLFLGVILVALGVVSGLCFGSLMNMYYKRKISQLELRLDISKAITEVIERLKKNPYFNGGLEGIVDSLLGHYKSRHIVRFMLRFRDRASDTSKKNTNSLMTKEVLSKLESKKFEVTEEMKMFSDIIALVVLCILHASTYNFFLGGVFRKLIFGDVIHSPKLAEKAAERKDFIERLDVQSIFGNMPKVA